MADGCMCAHVHGFGDPLGRVCHEFFPESAVVSRMLLPACLRRGGVPEASCKELILILLHVSALFIEQ